MKMIDRDDPYISYFCKKRPIVNFKKTIILKMVYQRP